MPRRTLRRCRPLLVAVPVLIAAALLGPRGASAATSNTVAGWVSLGYRHDVAGARIRVETVGGKPIAGAPRARSGDHGTFVLDFGAKPVPRRYAIVAVGGKAGPFTLPGRIGLSAIARRADGPAEIHHVNVASTLERGWAVRHPKRSLAAAERRVRRVLGIPAWHDLGFDLRASNRWFDPQTVLRKARTAGGLRPFLRGLAAKVRNGRPARFPAAPSARIAQAPFTPKWVVAQLVGGIIGKVGGAGFGWATDSIGLTGGPDPTQEAIAELRQQLSELSLRVSALQDSINALNARVEALSTQDLQANLNNARSALDTALEDIEWITNSTLAPDLLDKQTRILVDQDLKPIATNAKPWGSTRQLLANALLTPPPGTKTLELSANDTIKAENVFFTPADSTRLRQMSDFWDYYVAQTLLVYMEYQHTVGAQDLCPAPPAVITAQNCVLQAEADATSALLDGTSGILAGVAPVPAGTAVDIRTKLMWYSAAPASQTTLNDFAANTRAANAARSWAGFPDFRSPTQAEVLTLLHAKDGSLPQQWLPSDAGFGAGWGALPSATPVWSGTVASTTNDACSNAGHQIYWTPTMDTRSSTARLCGTIAGAVGIPVRGTGSERYYLG